jgi:hypothetical protein
MLHCVNVESLPVRPIAQPPLADLIDAGTVS